MSSATAVAPGRLRNSQEIAAVRGARNQRAGRLVVLHARDALPDPAVRMAVVASKKVGGAVARNRAKRLIREAARTIAWRPGTDLVVVARMPCAASRLEEVRADLQQLARALNVSEDS